VDATIINVECYVFVSKIQPKCVTRVCASRNALLANAPLSLANSDPSRPLTSSDALAKLVVVELHEYASRGALILVEVIAGRVRSLERKGEAAEPGHYRHPLRLFAPRPLLPRRRISPAQGNKWSSKRRRAEDLKFANAAKVLDAASARNGCSVTQECILSLLGKRVGKHLARQLAQAERIVEFPIRGAPHHLANAALRTIRATRF
jgi:hypothetical protein